MAVIVISLLLAGCTASDPMEVGAVAVVSPAAMTLPAAEAGGAGRAQPDYRIGPLDLLDVSIFQVPDLARTVQVSANGLIGLPLIGSVQAAGKTVADLEADIARRYGSTYLQSPQVSVFVHDAISQRVTVNGEVNKPGVYPTAGRTTLMQSVAMAGGLTDIADADGVVILRNAAGKREAAKFDLSAIQAGKADDPLLQGGDTVVVDQSGSKAAWKNMRQAIPAFGSFIPLL